MAGEEKVGVITTAENFGSSEYNWLRYKGGRVTPSELTMNMYMKCSTNSLEEHTNAVST